MNIKHKLINFFNLTRSDKQVKFLTIFLILFLFIFSLDYSLSMFTSNNGFNGVKVANIKINDLSFNMTTNGGQSDDRVLHLQAGKFEQFNVVLTNLNKINVKYELIYELCNDSNCTSTSKNIPNEIKVGRGDLRTEINGILDNNLKEIIIETQNSSDKDYYIKLNINVSYVWNELELANQISDGIEKNSFTQIVAYVDGIETSTFPSSCNYIAEIKGYNGDTEIELEDAKATCDFLTKKWSIHYSGPVSKIILKLNFSSGLIPGTFKEDSWTKIAEIVRNGQGEAYPVGSEKEVSVAGINYTVRVANNTTPSECKQDGFSQTACGFVIEFVDIVGKRKMNTKQSNIGGWPATEMRTYVNGDFFVNLPNDLQEIIIETKAISSHGSSDSANFVTNDKVYFLSAHEVYSDILAKDTAYNNTRQIDYYVIKGVTTNNTENAIKQYDGSNTGWLLRSARADSPIDFIGVSSSGSLRNFDGHVSYGFAPAFRIG